MRAITCGYHAAGNRTRPVADGLLVVNTERPGVTDTNVLLHPTVSTAAAATTVLATVTRALEHAAVRTIQVGAAPAAPLEARLAVEGWDVEAVVDMLLDGDLSGAPRPLDIRPVEGEADWASLRRLWRVDHVEEAERGQRAAVPTAFTDAVVGSKRAKQPALHLWLAAVDGHDAAFVTSWADPAVGGQVEDLFTAPTHRGRGLARALLHHAVADLHGRSDGPVMISSRVGDTPAQLYARLGFRPVLVRRIWSSVSTGRAADGAG